MHADGRGAINQEVLPAEVGGATSLPPLHCFLWVFLPGIIFVQRYVGYNSFYFQSLKKKQQPYSISACSDTIVLCNSCSVCNAMH